MDKKEFERIKCEILHKYKDKLPDNLSADQKELLNLATIIVFCLFDDDALFADYVATASYHSSVALAYSIDGERAQSLDYPLTRGFRTMGDFVSTQSEIHEALQNLGRLSAMF